MESRRHQDVIVKNCLANYFGDFYMNNVDAELTVVWLKRIFFIWNRNC